MASSAILRNPKSRRLLQLSPSSSSLYHSCCRGSISGLSSSLEPQSVIGSNADARSLGAGTLWRRSMATFTRTTNTPDHHTSLPSPLPSMNCATLLGISPNLKQLHQIHAQLISNSMLSSSSNFAFLIQNYISTNEPYDSLKVFACATSHNKFTHLYAFSACARLRLLHVGMEVHARAIKCGLADDLATQTTAINFYADCQDINSARKLFDEIPTKSSVTWNTMLNAYSTNGDPRRTFLLLYEMLTKQVNLTERTAVVLLSACSQAEDLSLVSSTHGFILKFSCARKDCFIGTELVDMYSKCGSLDNARKVFNELCERNVLTWTAMVSGLARHGKGREALEMMDEMEQEGVWPNKITFTCVLSACCHAGLLEEGIRIFDDIERRFGLEPVVQHYACLVDLFGRVGLVKEAWEVVRRMPIKPDSVVWRALLSACKLHEKREIGEEVGRMLLQLAKERKKVLEKEKKEKGDDCYDSCEDFVALSNVYALGERWEEVEMVREAMKWRGVKNKGGISFVQFV